MPCATLLYAAVIISELVCFCSACVCLWVWPSRIFHKGTLAYALTPVSSEKRKSYCFLVKDICHCYWISFSLKAAGSPRQSALQTECHLAALVSAEERRMEKREEGEEKREWLLTSATHRRWAGSEESARVYGKWSAATPAGGGAHHREGERGRD